MKPRTPNPRLPRPAAPAKRGAAAPTNDARLRAAITLHQQQQLDQAEALYKDILQSEPRHFDALQLLATVTLQRGGHAAAVELFDRALKIKPNHASSLSNRGSALHALGRHAEALASFDLALTFQPEHVDALNNRGGTLLQLARHAEALDSLERALKQRPAHPDALCNRGDALSRLGRHEEALACFDQALALQPALTDALRQRANMLVELKRHGEALVCHERLLALKPDDADALYNRGNALSGLERFQEALESFDRALQLRPEHGGALNNRGNTLMALKRYAEAVASFDRLLANDADNLNALNNRGNALRELKRLDESLESFDRALRCNPRHADILKNRGDTLMRLKRVEDALESYRRTLEIEPGHEFLSGVCLHLKMKLCDWNGLERQATALMESVERGENASVPFTVLTIPSTPAQQKKAAETWARSKQPKGGVSAPAPASTPRRIDGDKIRIGYFSADFREHPVSFLTVELFELHDKSRFELFAFSFGPDAQDDTRKRLTAAFDHFIDVKGHSDAEVAALANSLGIDIAIDMGGYTDHSRPGIFALRAAPIQVNYLGYPGTMGAQSIDYLIADQILVPPAERPHYAEKIAYLPSYQPNDRQRRIADKVFARSEQGLPDTGFVYCCFNNNYKILPDTFDSWMRILKAVDGSVLWLAGMTEAAERNLENEARRRGVDAGRLVFAKRVPLLEDHLARYRLADLFLDTLPYNAHATASDALWAGLPVLTRIGETFAGRVAASVLNAIGLPELITSTAAEYEALAVALAGDQGKLQGIREKLAGNRDTSALFDSRRYTRHMEAAFAAMVERSRAGLGPEHIFG